MRGTTNYASASVLQNDVGRTNKRQAEPAYMRMSAEDFEQWLVKRERELGIKRKK